MSKGLDNLYDFNITCKKCGSEKITATEVDGYIKLICLDCEALKGLDKFLNFNSNFIKDLLINHNTIFLKKSLLEILDDSKKALELQIQIANILNEDYMKHNEDDNYGFVYDNSPFKDTIFSICKKLENLKIIEDITELKNEIYFNIGTYGKPVKNEQFKVYELKHNSYDLALKLEDNNVKSDNYKLKLDEFWEFDCDTILMAVEIDGHIKSLRRTISKLESLINSLD